MTPTLIVKIGHGPYDVYIGRAGHGQSGYFGNSYQVGVDGTRAEVVSLFDDDFHKRIAVDQEYRAAVLGLRGKRLGCFCECSPETGCPICATERARRGYSLDCHGWTYIDWLKEHTL